MSRRTRVERARRRPRQAGRLTREKMIGDLKAAALNCTLARIHKNHDGSIEYFAVAVDAAATPAQKPPAGRRYTLKEGTPISLEHRAWSNAVVELRYTCDRVLEDQAQQN